MNTTTQIQKTKTGEFIIRKNRNGTLGTVKLAWIGQYTAFYSTALDGSNRSFGEYGLPPNTGPELYYDHTPVD